MARIKLDAVRSEHYDHNTRNGEHPNGCLICGKAVKEGRGGMVWYLNTGELASANEDVSPEEDQGAFPVGPECMKKPALRNFIVG